MCDPVTMMAVSATTKGLQIWGQRQMTKSQFGALAAQREAQNEEIAGKAGREIGERVKQGRAERARMLVAAGEAGVGGQSFAASMMDIAFQQDQDVAARGKDADYQQRASEAQYQSNLASIRNPGFLENTLQIAKAGAGGYVTGLQIKKARGKV